MELPLIKKVFYRKRNKLIEENWHPEIEWWEKKLADPKRLLDCDGEYCRHKRKVELPLIKKVFYRKRNKLSPEDWHPEIEWWEKKIVDPKRIPYMIMRIMEKAEEDEERLLDCDGEYCGHKRKVDFEGKYVCWDCGRELGRHIGSSIGYHFKNHTMRSVGKK